MMVKIMLLFWCWGISLAVELVFPSPNQALTEGRFEDFFMYVDRNFEERITTPWQGGTYGFCRNPRRVEGEIVYTKFHEGIDIAPVVRDENGIPQDFIVSVAAGKIVYLNDVPAYSNYGRYVVVEHNWEGCYYYSLYAHLADVRVQIGAEVAAGDTLGLLGWTGDGLNLRRAHVHFEVCLLMSENFQHWFEPRFTTPNRHGDFNGMNLLGVDAAQFLLCMQVNPELSFIEFLGANTEEYWQVLVPKGQGKLSIVERYPWLQVEEEGGATRSWRITFSAVGIPLRVEPEVRNVEQLTLVSVRPSVIDHRYLTRGHLTGTGNQASLTSNGRNFLALVLQEGE